MTYEETMAWISKVGQSGIVLGLERMEELLKRMGRPERSLKMIHVAGTNGKGSVCTFIASILEEAGYKVGRYISPTLYDYRERIQINGVWIDSEELAELMSDLRDVCEAMAAEGREVPTAFEVETAAGFLYFKKKGCDYVVLETGMGGRLDSTNVVEHPILTVITPVSMDHMAQLGPTLADIAREKAGILKAGTPAVFSEQKPEAMTALLEKCREIDISPKVIDGASIRRVERRLFDGDGGMEAVQTFDYKYYKALEIHLGGTYQIDNACLAIEAVEALNLHLEAAVIYRGLLQAKWPGRFQCLSKKPMIFIDGAHNPAGAKSLRESIETYFKGRRILSVMGVFADKDYMGILDEICRVSSFLISFTPPSPRGLDSGQLKSAAESRFEQTVDAKTAENALKIAKEAAGAEDVIIIFGSLSTISTFCDIIGTLSEVRNNFM